MPKVLKRELPQCQLSGTDGNVFSIISNVSRTLRRAGQHEQAAKFRDEAMNSASYDDVLALCFKYVDVE